MRAWLLVACLLLAGCAAQEGTTSLEVQDTSAGVNETAPPENATVPENKTSADASVDNATVPDTGNATGNVTAPVLILDETFSGFLPVDGATVGEHQFTMPAGGTRIQFTYTSEYVGLFHAVAELVDPAGTTIFYTIDDCGIALAPGAETHVCLMEDDLDLVPGEWQATVSYQAGQVVEQYTLEVLAWG